MELIIIEKRGESNLNLIYLNLKSVKKQSLINMQKVDKRFA